jgi:hypothetical protein
MTMKYELPDEETLARYLAMLREVLLEAPPGWKRVQ